jgi:hypothetical protein
MLQRMGWQRKRDSTAQKVLGSAHVLVVAAALRPRCMQRVQEQLAIGLFSSVIATVHAGQAYRLASGLSHLSMALSSARFHNTRTA